VQAASKIVAVAFALACVCACGSATDGTPAANDTEEAGRIEASDAATGAGWQARSQAGLYRISIRPEQGAARIGALHSWLVEVASRSGAPVAPTQLVFDGGMPQHRHGFETSPRVTDVLGDGVFRVDGVRFQMPGTWTLRVDVAAADGIDFALFEVEVGP
jgi:hypothetical protein